MKSLEKKFLKENLGYDYSLSNSINLDTAFGKTNDQLKFEFAKELGKILPGVNPYAKMAMLQAELLSNVDKISKSDFQVCMNNALANIPEDFYGLAELEADDENDDDDDDLEADEAREDFEACEDVEDLTLFLEEWCDRSALKEVVRFLNKEFGYRFRIALDDEELIAQLVDHEDLEFEELYDAIDDSVDLD
jgi:hypothetical protein